MADLASYLQSVKLPVMPEVAHALIRTLNDPSADLPMVRGVISKDPSLTATLLRMANSAIFGLSRSVNSLDNAVSVVGISQIRARALSICIANAFILPSSLNRLDFWRDCMVCGGYAKWLAGHSSLDEQQAWLTGMMMRLGQAVIALHSPHLIEHIEQQPRGPGERWVRERKAVGFDEGEITAELARRWDFPEAMSDALDYCARPLAAPQFSKLSAVVHLAGRLTDQPTLNGEEAIDALPADVLNSLGLDKTKLQKTIPKAEAFSDVSMLQA